MLTNCHPTHEHSQLSLLASAADCDWQKVITVYNPFKEELFCGPVGRRIICVASLLLAVMRNTGVVHAICLLSIVY
jgi:hypothetical protein